MARQKFDIGDLVQFKNHRGLVLDRKAINPNYNTDREFHVDEYTCKVKFIDKEVEEKPRWVRAKWLKLISKSS